MATKQPVDPNFNPKPGGKRNPYPSGNEGRMHPGMKLVSYVKERASDHEG